MMHNYGALLAEIEKLDDAEPLLEEALERRRDALGHPHADTCQTMHNLAVGYHGKGKLAQELALLPDASGSHRARPGRAA